MGDRGLWLVHGDGGPPDPGVGQAGGEQPVGEGLDQVDRVAGDDGDQRVGEFAVVHGVGDVVGARRGAEVEFEDDVDDEVLPFAALEVVHAVVAAGPQPGQGDAVGHAGLLSGVQPGPAGGGPDGQGVDGAADVVHPYAPGAGGDGEQAGGGGGDVAFRRRAGRPSRSASSRPR